MSAQTIQIDIAPRGLHQGHPRVLGAILLDNGVLTPEGINRILKLMLDDPHLRFGEAALKLGLVTQDEVEAALAQQLTWVSLPQIGRHAVSDELVAACQPFSAQADELRSIGGQLLVRWFDGDPRHMALAIVSLDRGDGRSFVAANLAVVFSQIGRRTLLVDADLKSPRQHQLFQVDNRTGFSSVLAGEDVDGAVLPIKGFPHLHLMTAGALPANSLEQLGRHGFDALLERAAEQFDVVLFDTPAIADGVDACVLALRASAALVVARSHQTEKRAFSDMVRSLRRSGCSVVGSVLNDPDPVPFLSRSLSA